MGLRHFAGGPSRIYMLAPTQPIQGTLPRSISPYVALRARVPPKYGRIPAGIRRPNTPK